MAAASAPKNRTAMNPVFKCSGGSRNAAKVALLAITTVATSMALAQSGVALAPPQARADAQSNPDLSVVVSASRSGATLAEMPLYTTVVTPEQIRNSPAQTTDQLLRNTPGINLTGAPFYTTDPTGNQIKMRGLTNAKVLMLLDGAPLLDPFYTTVQWFKVPPSSIERIEVIRGGNSSLWGNLAVAGVVNVVSRKPTDSSGELMLSGGSTQTYNGAAFKNVVLSDTLSMTASADFLSSGGYQTTPNQYLSQFPGKGNSSTRNYNGRLAFYFKPSSDLRAYIRSGYHYENQDIGGYRFGANLQQGSDVAMGLNKTFSDRSQLALNSWWQHIGFDKLNGAGCYLQTATNCNTTSTLSPLVQYANSHDWNPYGELGASAVYSIPIATWINSLQLGVDYRKIWGEDSATTYNRPTTLDAASATINRTNFGKGRQQFIGAFAQARLVPVDPLELTLSARYDHWTNSDGVSTMTRYDDASPGPITGGSIPDSSKGSFNPTLAVRWDVSDQWDVRGAAYKSFRAPGLNNLYRSFSSTASITIANPELVPETLKGGEIGTDFRTRDIEVNATAWLYNVDNLIASFKVANAASAPPQAVAICGTALANCPATVNFNTNGQNGRSYGVEIGARWHVAAPVTLDATYVRTRSYYTSSSVGDPIGEQLGAVPANVVTAGLAWQTTPAWWNYAQLRWAGGMFLDVNHTIGQPAFTVFNLSTAYLISKELSLFASIVNLFNQHYADNATTSASSSILGLPRSLTAGLRWRF
jgi:outer membrane receptor protein involved in Fe transport